MSSNTKRIHVVAAAIFNQRGEVLIAKRPDHVHQGGLWEFPGGKLESGEAVEQALQRELHEELGVDVLQARPLIQIRHDYPDKSVLLDVWCVSQFVGEAHGREGQPVKWVSVQQLSNYTFPAANRPIISAVSLPQTYLITPEPDDEAQFINSLEVALRNGVRLLQLRAHSLAPSAYESLAKKVILLAHHYDAKVLLNAEPDVAQALGADGAHLNSQRLMALQSRPLPTDMLVAASCHSEAELRQAEKLQADFAVLSPVKQTLSHPQVQPLEWERFHAMVQLAALPVYALGGLGEEDLPTAFQKGAQGVAAIRAFWQ